MSTKKKQTPEIFGSLSDVGSVREHNEDSLAASPPLFAVADGMGGHEAGEVASAIAIDTMLANVPSSCSSQELAHAVREANRAVLRGAANGTGKPGMGTTMTAALIYGDELAIAQVGDSRAYLLHEGSLQRITRDHSLVADLIEQGRITEEEARYHPQRSVITRALGSDPNMEPDIYSLRVELGDRLLLCSDGLTSMVDDAAVEALLTAHDDPQECCSALVAEALAAGGLDNVTVVVVDPLREEPKPEITARGKQPRVKGSRRNRFAPFLWVLAFVAVIALVVGAFSLFTSNSYFLATNSGHVCIYRGVPGNFAGLRAAWLEEETDVEADKLAATTAERLNEGIAMESLEDAHNHIDQYRSIIEANDYSKPKTVSFKLASTAGAGSGLGTRSGGVA